MGNLRARKKQYILMTVGIVLAMVFSSGVLFFVFCMNESVDELGRKFFGCQDGIVCGGDESIMQEGLEQGFIDNYTVAQSIGYINSEGSAEKKGTVVAKYSAQALEMAYISLEEGRMPEKAGEIVVENDALIRMKLSAVPGDKITVNLSVQNGEDLLPQTIEKTYTLVGILSDKRSNFEADNDRFSQKIPAAIVSEEELIEAGGKALPIYYFTYEKHQLGSSSDKSWSDMYTYFLESGSDYVVGHSFFGFNNTDYSIRLKTALGCVLAAVLLIASCVGIVNAFNTNLMERKRQIGMLRAVGTTRRQIITIFGREAFIVSVIATPLSVFISYWGTKLVISFFGDGFVFLPKVWILVACGAFSIVCVMAAALIPLVRASKISPMQAIRSIDMTRKVKTKKIKTNRFFSVPKLLAKRGMTFGKARMISVSIILAVAIIATSAGFSLIDGVHTYYSDNDSDYQIQRTIWTNSSFCINTKSYGIFGLSDNTVNEILSSRHVASVSCTSEENVNVIVDEMTPFLQLLCLSQKSTYIHSDSQSFVPGINSENFLKKLGDAEYNDMSRHIEMFREKYSGGSDIYNAVITAADESKVATLGSNLIEGEINLDKLNSGEEIILVSPKQIGFGMTVVPYFGGTDVSFSTVLLDENGDALHMGDGFELLATEELTYHAGDTIDMSILFDDEEHAEGYATDENPFDGASVRKYDKKVKIGAIVTAADFSSAAHNECSFVTTNSGLASFGFAPDYTLLDIYLKEECTIETDEDMTQLIESVVSGTNFDYTSEFGMAQDNEKQYQVILTALVSILLLMFCVAASLISNALTSRIRQSKNEIGTLRAVGASARELTQSYILQLLAMFGIGCTAGFGIYSVAFAIGSVVCKVKEIDMPLEFDVLRALAVCAVLFLICSVNLWIKIRQQLKYSIVENIREL